MKYITFTIGTICLSYICVQTAIRFGFTPLYGVAVYYLAFSSIDYIKEKKQEILDKIHDRSTIEYKTLSSEEELNIRHMLKNIKMAKKRNLNLGGE